MAWVLAYVVRYAFMAVLSDATIKQRIAELVPNGTPERAEHAPYQLTAGKVYFGGSDANHSIKIVDFTCGENLIPAVIEPGALVWVRTRDQVNIPSDMVGLWTQINKLSRKGLLLLNMTLVEPGYQGPLIAAFVNFGREPVYIDASTRIAKLAFLRLDRAAEALAVAREVSSCDTEIARIAMSAPADFLRLGEFVPELKTEELAARKRLEEAAELLRRKTRATVATAIEQQKKETMLDIKSGVNGYVWRALGGFAAGAAVIFMFFLWTIDTFIPVLGGLSQNLDTRANAAVQRALDQPSVLEDIHTIRAQLSPGEISDMQSRLDALEHALALVKQENDALRAAVSSKPE